MVVHEATHEAYLAQLNAALGRADALPAKSARFAASLTRYASVGLTEATARESHDVVVGTERSTHCRAKSSTVARRGSASSSPSERSHVLGSHIVGEQAVEARPMRRSRWRPA